MLASSLRRIAIVLLSAGLLLAVPGGAAVEAKSKKAAPKVDKKAAAKSAKGKKDRRDDRKAKAGRRDDRTAKRGKNGKAEKPTRRDRDVKEARASRPAPSRRPSEPVVSKAAEVDEDEPDEPPAPRAANRLVADMPTHRVVEIQNALIKEGVLVGPPSGVYDQATFDAMSAFQVRKGYKPVGVPTAYSLRDLGVRKNSGYAATSPARVVEATAP